MVNVPFCAFGHYPANIKHVYNIYTMLYVVQMFCVCWVVFSEYAIEHVADKISLNRKAYKQRPSHLRQPRDLSLQVTLTQRSATETAFSVQGPVLWNKLPHDIKTANSVNIFKKLKTHFFRIYFT